MGVDQIDVLVGRCHYRGGIAGRVVLEPFVGEVVEVFVDGPGSDPLLSCVDIERSRVAVSQQQRGVGFPGLFEAMNVLEFDRARPMA